MEAYAGDLALAEVDVIVATQSSQSLLDSFFAVLGDSSRNRYDEALREDPHTDSITLVPPANERLVAKKIYLLPWRATTDPIEMDHSLGALIAEAMQRAVSDGYQTVAFPAIGCGRAGILPSVVAHIMVQEVHRQLQKHPLSVLFVIHPQRTDILDHFQKKIQGQPQLKEPTASERATFTVGQGSVMIEMGDLAQQTVTDTALVDFEENSFLVF